MGRIVDCPKCQRLSCVCAIIKAHKIDCKFRMSATCPAGVECNHGRDVCPECDPCTCGNAADRKKYR